MYLFLDTETTGLDRYNDHVVQVAWLLVDRDGNVHSSECHIIKPVGYSIPWGASQIHGITTDVALNTGEPLADILELLSEDVHVASVVVAHNLSFDLGILESDYLNAELDFPFHGKNKLCTMKLSTEWCGLPKKNGSAGFKWPKLEELHHLLFGETFDGAHDALEDAKACMRCYFELVEIGVIDYPMNLRPRGVTTSPPEIKSFDEIISLIYKDASEVDIAIRKEVAANKSCPSEALDCLLIVFNWDDDHDMLRIIANNPSISSWARNQYISWQCNDQPLHLELLVILAANPACDAENFKSLSERGDYSICLAAAENQSCDTATLAKIRWLYPEGKVSEAVLSNRSYSPSVFNEFLLEKLRENPLTPKSLVKAVERHKSGIDDISENSEEALDSGDNVQDVAENLENIKLIIDHSLWESLNPVPLVLLADHPNEVVRVFVAANHETPANIIRELAKDSCPLVRAAVAGNLMCPKNLFIEFAKDSVGEVRINAAKNLNCSLMAIKYFSESPFYEYRVLAASHPNCYTDLFQKLAADKEAVVRIAVVKNDNCPIEIRAPLFMAERADLEMMNEEDCLDNNERVDEKDVSNADDDNSYWPGRN